MAAALLTLGLWVAVAAILVSSDARREALEIPAAHAQAMDGVFFYGTEFEGDSFVFCLDASGSMGWNGEIDRLKAETTQAIQGLSGAQHFSVVAFATETRTWSSFLRRALPAFKATAISWVQQLNAAGASCIDEAVLTSLSILTPFLVPGPRKAVLLVTDGTLYCGNEDTTYASLENIGAANYHRIPIHTICLSGSGAYFCETVASQSGGKFVYRASGPPSPPPPLPPPPPPAPPPIVRGDANGDESVSGLVDGTFLLNYQFIPGSLPPPCFDAADADDDGIVSGLLDAVFLLGFQFTPGNPAPPDPGPVECGEDPTADGLSCVRPPECP